MLNPAKILVGGLADHTRALFKLNAVLAREGYPFFWNGGKNFETRYRLWPKPQYLGMWRPPFIRIKEIYLSLDPETPDQVDFVFDCDRNHLEVLELGLGDFRQV